MNLKPSLQAEPVAKAGRYLTFTLGDESYGLPVLNVREIIRLCPITPVPRMPAHVKGVINLRGTVIAVFDLRIKFQVATTSYGERACIIVVQVSALSGGNILMGAIVDAVEEVVHLTAAEIEPTPDFGGAPDTQYILGLATSHGRVKTLLNIEKIFLEDPLSVHPMPKPEPSTKPK
jgi:purine-binding chemotaxis protein CheW